MHVSPLLTNSIKKSVNFLRSGRLVAFPTGTSYGLAADVLQGHALQRLRNLKARPQDKSFTIFLSEELWEEFLDLTTQELDYLAQHRAQPLTLLVKPQAFLAHLAHEGRVGLRLIDHPLMQRLAAAYRSPLTATSANPSGQPACFDPECITKYFPGQLADNTYDLSLAAILTAGSLPEKPPSRLVKLVAGQEQRLR
jgi:L-threonylcarbamoyladenylate synthase